MSRYIEINNTNINNLIKDNYVISCKLRNSRIKSKQLAILEILLLNYDLNILFIKNGPLSDVKGIISFLINKDKLDILTNRLEFIGYSNEFYILDFNNIEENNTSIETINPLVWKGLKYTLNTLYIQDESIYKKLSPHNRDFKIYDINGDIKDVNGYRGDGTTTGRRALPVEDARILVNLSGPFNNKYVLEPFAGGGGIVYMYKYLNKDINITSIDIDETIKPGLVFYGSNHIVGDSSKVDLKDIYDTLVTEVPFSNTVTKIVCNALKKQYNSLSNKALIVLMCDIDQTNEITDTLNELNSNLIFTKDLNRKGTDVTIQVWTKDINLYNELKETIEILYKIY